MPSDHDSRRGSLRGFRHASLEGRRALARERISVNADDLGSAGAAPAGIDPFGSDTGMVELANVMVESAIGYVAVPLGVATGFLINDRTYDVPMATEEPSVVAAATYAARRIAAAGGFRARAGTPITSGHLYLERCSAGASERLMEGADELEAAAAPLLGSMAGRGGGWVGVSVTTIGGGDDPAGAAMTPGPLSHPVIRLQFDIDVRDAMGANRVNTIAEMLRPVAERLSGGTSLMSILTNASDHRVAQAEFALPCRILGRAEIPGNEVGRRIVAAAEIAWLDDQRAVTHNKGIMNGITALALATGNDTRALEAAAHHHAARDGRYRALSRYEVRDDTLFGTIEIPVPLGTVGGAAGIHPTCRAALELLGAADSGELAAVAAAVGLAQNFAALHALCTEGIQRGHMGLHANRVAWMAGARGAEIDKVTRLMRDEGDYSTAAAARLLEKVRGANL